LDRLVQVFHLKLILQIAQENVFVWAMTRSVHTGISVARIIVDLIDMA